MKGGKGKGPCWAVPVEAAPVGMVRGGGDPKKNGTVLVGAVRVGGGPGGGRSGWEPSWKNGAGGGWVGVGVGGGGEVKGTRACWGGPQNKNGMVQVGRPFPDTLFTL